MTPLALMIVRDMLDKNEFRDEFGLASKMGDIHCFEMTDVHGEAVRLAQDVTSLVGSEVTSFLPAPKTWIEWRWGQSRLGFWLEIADDGFVDVIEAVNSPEQESFRTLSRYRVDLNRAARLTENNASWHVFPRFSPDSLIIVFLAMINTPRVLGRKQNMPHAGLERRLAKAHRAIGYFPLNAWTEITLPLAPLRDVSSESSHEAHLSGRRALHFCRAHLRICDGKIVHVRAHWRGDAGLGTRHSRYRVAA